MTDYDSMHRLLEMGSPRTAPTESDRSVASCTTWDCDDVHTTTRKAPKRLRGYAQLANTLVES